MKKTILFAGMAGMAMFGMSACGGGSTYNSAANSANRAGNTVANAGNSVAATPAKAAAPSPAEFIKEAGEGGMEEVALGKLATQRSKNAEVKKFGQMMVDDHSKAKEELKALAGKKNIPVPADMGAHKSEVDSLSALAGPDFDKKYVEMMVGDHEKDVAAFQMQADNSSDPDVKAFAAKTLPTLKKHLDAIQAIKGKM
ncbi:MAG: DUF4142 domain-containing protein [Pyrinomonadaceae bacterium]